VRGTTSTAARSVPQKPRMSAERFALRKYEPGDEAAILELFTRSFFHERPLAHWQWKFQENPWGNERIILAFDEGRRLVAQYTGYPVPFRHSGRDLFAYQIGDTMTDVSVRNVGRGPTSVLARTTFAFYDAYCRGQAAFTYGFNVGNIQKFCERFLDIVRVEAVPYRALDLERHPLQKLSRWERLLGGYQLELVSKPGPEFDDFFSRVEPHYGFLVRRDREYLQWRYFDVPDTKYFMVSIRKWSRLAGWIVFRIREDRFTIGDALFDPRFAAAPAVLLRHLVPSYPVRLVEGWFPDRPQWFSGILASLGFEARPDPLDLALMCSPFEFADAVDRMRSELYYTWGDSDLF
jgi:hypothetical protein